MPLALSFETGHRFCPFCSSEEVLRSKRRNLFEWLILPLLLFRPFRCRQCSARHYGFFFRKRVTSAPDLGNFAAPRTGSPAHSDPPPVKS